MKFYEVFFDKRYSDCRSGSVGCRRKRSDAIGVLEWECDLIRGDLEVYAYDYEEEKVGDDRVIFRDKSDELGEYDDVLAVVFLREKELL